MKKKESLGKEEALKIAIKNMNNTLGVGSVMFGEEGIPSVEMFSSGCYSLDAALGGGWAVGRIAEIYGPESSGKTTLTLHAIAEAQKNGGFAAFIDVEHAFDPTYAEAIGVDIEKLIFSQPNSGEQALQIVSDLIKTGSLDLVVVDSVAALTPKAEIDGEIGDHHIGKQAKLMSQAMRLLSIAAHDNNTTLIFINQIRMKIGVMFGSPETTSGGNALKFYASQRVDVRKVGKVKEGAGDNITFTANLTRAKIVKNKVAPPFRQANFTIEFGTGIDKYLDLLDSATKEGIIKKAGAWFSYKGENIGQGKTKTAAYLQENPDVYIEVRKLLEQGEEDESIRQCDVPSLESSL